MYIFYADNLILILFAIKNIEYHENVAHNCNKVNFVQRKKDE